MARHAAPSPPWMTLSRAGASPPRSCSAGRRRAPTSAAPTPSTACGGIGRRRSSGAPAPPGGRAGARAIARRRAAAVPPRPPGDRQGARGLRFGRGPGAAPHAGRPAPGRRLRAAELLDADCSAGPRRVGLPVGRPDPLELHPAGSANVVATAFAASGLLEAGADTGRSTSSTAAARRRAGPSTSSGSNRGLLRLSRRPPREHPQREACSAPGWSMWGRAGEGIAPRARRPRRAAHAGRAAQRRVVGLRRGERPRLGRLVPHGLRAPVPGSPACRGRPGRRRGRAGRRPLPRVLRRVGPRAPVGGQALSGRTRIPRARG